MWWREPRKQNNRTLIFKEKKKAPSQLLHPQHLLNSWPVKYTGQVHMWRFRQAAGNIVKERTKYHHYAQFIVTNSSPERV